jgi:hypothetical protein
MSDARPLVLLDVDGVLNLARFLSSRQRDRLLHGRPYGTNKSTERGWVHRWSAERHYSSRIVTHPKYGEWLRPLAEHAELAWATTWMAEANWHIGPLLGLPELRYAPAPYGSKAVHVVAWTQGRPWAWLDDQAEELDMASALSKGRPHLPVLVNRADGLTEENVSQVHDWLKSL